MNLTLEWVLTQPGNGNGVCGTDGVGNDCDNGNGISYDDGDRCVRDWV